MRSQFSFEGAGEDGGEQGVQFGGGPGLQALQRVHLRLQRVQLGHDPALLGPIGLPQRGNVIQPSGCEERATLGTRIKIITYPNGVVANRYATDDATPSGMEIISTTNPR